MQKRILFLGASNFQISPIKYAKEQGHYVITCDYLPENPGHKLADEYHNVSTTDKEAVLELSKKLKIDGIVAYASDPSAPTQAYVAKELGLPSNPYESVMTLSRKDLFRDFLKKHNFYTPESKSFNNYEEACEYASSLSFPLIIKPVDSSGSKGVMKIDTIDEMQTAFVSAFQFSREKKVVVEEFFVRDGYQIGGDGFIVNGKLVFRGWTNTYFDIFCNPLVPTGGSLPSKWNESALKQIDSEVERLLGLLNMNIGALNCEFNYDKNGNLFIVEIGPRNGGNLIPELIRYATGVDMIKYTVDAALGLDCSDLEMKGTEGFYSYYVLHANQDGVVKDIFYSDEIKKNIIEENLFVEIGDNVKKFNGSNHTLGIMIMKFSTQEEMLEKMDNMEKYLKVVLK